MEIFDKARQSLNEKTPFAIFRKPGQNSVTGIFQRDNVSHGCNKWTDSGFVFAPFSNSPCWILPQRDCDVITSDFKASASVTATPELQIDAASKAAFESLVAKGISAIQQNRFSKVVLSRSENVAVPNFDAFDAFEKLGASYPSAFVYIWFHPETGIWMAATPEKLLEANATDFTTMALAGTQKFEGDLSVSWPLKEQQEQLFVTEYIWNSLEPIVSQIEIGAPYTVKAGNLLHIRTDIHGKLNDASDLGKVIDALHPTPAVCGMPKAQARDFIMENERYEREYYSGFLGALNLEQGTELYVNLRCMKVANEVATIFVGCGVTKDSDPEAEFFETVNKSLTIRKCLV